MTYTFSGVFVDEHGQPVSGARVVLRQYVAGGFLRWPGPATELATVSTTAKGAF